MDIRNKLAGLTAASMLLGFSSVAGAIVCNDPLPAGENRQIEFTVDSGTVSCYDSGSGNASHDILPNFLEKDESSVLGSGNNNGGYMNHDGIGNNSSGGFTVTGLTDFFMLLKFGGSGADQPDWFLLEVTGATSPVTGSWSWNSGDGTGLSHASLYGEPTHDVPEPGTLALMGLGLMGLGLARRRKA